MDNVCISDIEPSGVILSLTKCITRLKYNALIMPNQAEAKWDGVINPRNSNIF